MAARRTEPGLFRRCGCTEVVRDAAGEPVLTARGKAKRRELGAACPRLASDSKHGTWGFQIDVAPVSGSGKERQRIRRTGFKTKTEAKAARVAIEGKGDKASTRRVANDRITVGEWLDRWIAGRRNIRRATRVSYQGHIDNYLKPHLGAIKLRDLGSHQISAMFTAIEERNAEIRESLKLHPRGHRGEWIGAEQRAAGVTRERRRVMGPASMQRLRATLRKSLNDAIKEDPSRFGGVNPAKLVELASGSSPKPKLWTVETEKRWRETGKVPVSTMVWRPEQCGLFLDTAEGDPLYNLFELASRSGMRRGELCGLRWIDVDLDAKRLSVTVQLYADGKEGPTKSDAGERSVPLDDGLVAMLKAHRTQQRKNRLAWGEAWVDSGRVFTLENGDHLRPDSVSQRFRAIARSVGLPPVRLHAMRSGAASMALAAGVPMKTVSEMLGHASEAITSRVYTAVGDELKREAMVAIGGLIPRRTGTESS
ncbi:tyrosine-type recombinase/integrase [Amycolatopsis sp. NPDC051716]|uniref:tyrosine-type recombinase/integrase n=1 Tax=Amycolatopsis sp. NPDC051716 TaxID=3155804 RepID=UPI003437C086